MSTTKVKILVWDMPVRLGHWLLVLCFAVAWLTGESEERRLLHVFAGSAMIGIVLFRVLWGLIGSRYARFADFVRGPGPVLAYLKSLLGKAPQHYIGHNPAGGWAILALLALILVSGASGWLNYQELGGDWVEELHEVVVHVLLFVVAIHLAGVAIGGFAHRENLVRPMLTGLKSGDRGDGILGKHTGAALLLAGWTAAITWLLSR